MSERHLKRIGAATAAAEREGLAALVVSPSPDLRYLCAYDPPALERPTLLVVSPGRHPVLLVPELERSRALVSPLGEQLDVVAWTDGDDPYEAAARLLPAEGRIGATDQLWAAHLLGLQRAVPEADFAPGSEVLSELRAIKDREELELLARAGRSADEALRRLTQTRLEGMREEKVAASLADLLRETGHDSAAFTIVASGPNGASPHHESGGRPIRAKDAVVMDFGGQLSGYFSDITRTVCVGEPPEGFADVHDIVREAQEAAFRAVAPGVPAEEIDAVAREVITSTGYGNHFIHRTGHGIGLEIHEAPYIVQGNRRPLERGMCFSIEPGVYLEGRFGVRIEDIVAVTDKGAVRLNRSTRNLQTVA